AQCWLERACLATYPGVPLVMEEHHRGNDVMKEEGESTSRQNLQIATPHEIPAASVTSASPAPRPPTAAQHWPATPWHCRRSSRPTDDRAPSSLAPAPLYSLHGRIGPLCCRSARL